MLCYVMLWYVMLCWAMSCYGVLCYVMLCKEAGPFRGEPLDLAICGLLQYPIPLCLSTWWAFWLFYHSASLRHFLVNSKLPIWGWIRLHVWDPLFGEQYAACHARRTLEVPVTYAIRAKRTEGLGPGVILTMQMNPSQDPKPLVWPPCHGPRNIHENIFPAAGCMCSCPAAV